MRTYIQSAKKDFERVKPSEESSYSLSFDIDAESQVKTLSTGYMLKHSFLIGN
jgi:hypothetical protein